ncbi:hypothetical protein QWY84_16030 [Aquisalimonas lutea]|uniref:hypothetical protein n=1 Tax=Aquisalimonas lutea TaxID=1327750 RepID=UPI0025B2815C|nr:hypothetical protein [Aquisalimonas lutea]MDN3519124.1 hypothetical protein [Aquisalimonas lutea]
MRIDFVADSCRESFYLAVFDQVHRFPSSAGLKDGRAQLRVDRRDIRAGDVLYNRVPKTRLAEVAVVFDDATGVLRDLRNGHTARVRVLGGNDSWIAAFSLAGSNAAIQRAQALCEEYGADHEDYFENAPNEDRFQGASG